LSLRRVPLLDLHRSLGASIGEFAGYQTAISYGSVIDEHLSVRREAGIFDISHMTMILLSGQGLLEVIDRLVPKKLDKLRKGFILGPTVFLNEEAGIKDDVLVYPLLSGDYLVVGNAVNLAKDLEWLEQHSPPGSKVTLLNTEHSLLALQGPRSPELVKDLVPQAQELGRMSFLENVETSLGTIRLVSRSGWTGEDGFEFLAENNVAERLFMYFVNRGVKPCGLAARDTLRLEMGFLLYGQDMNEDTSPIEARYWIVFDQDKKNCVGCEALHKKLREGAREVRVGLKLKKGERTIPRTGARVTLLGEGIGRVTSGGYSPLLERPIAIAYLKPSHALMGLSVTVEVRGKQLEAKIVDFPFINK
jgi:aminomethyltransferase